MKIYTIKKQVFIDASPEAVFDALTTEDKVLKYYPLKAVISQWRVGEAVLYQGEVDGIAFTDYGTIEVLDRPTRYQYSYWSDNHGTQRTADNHLGIRYSMRAKVQGTSLELIHSKLQSAEMYTLMDGVWDSLLTNLKNYIEAQP